MANNSSVENELQQLYRMLVRQHRALLLCVCRRLFVAILLQAGPMSGETIPVRYPEGTTHGFLALRTLEGKLLASGELTEALHGNQVVSHLLFRFKDGSLDDETAVFSQRETFGSLATTAFRKGRASRTRRMFSSTPLAAKSRCVIRTKIAKEWKPTT